MLIRRATASTFVKVLSPLWLHGGAEDCDVTDVNYHHKVHFNVQPCALLTRLFNLFCCSFVSLLGHVCLCTHFASLFGRLFVTVTFPQELNHLYSNFERKRVTFRSWRRRILRILFFFLGTFQMYFEILFSF